MGVKLKSLNPVNLAKKANPVSLVKQAKEDWVPVRNAVEDAASIYAAAVTYGGSVPFTSKMVSDGAATSDNKLFKLDRDRDEAQKRAVETARLQGQAYADAAKAGLGFSQPGAGNLLAAYSPGYGGGSVGGGSGGGGASPVIVQQSPLDWSPLVLLLLAAGAFWVYKKG